MIELTEEQLQAIEIPAATPPRLLNPHTQEAFVLLRVDEYERLTEAYDDSPWSRNEMEALAWNAAERAGWEGDDDKGEKP